MTSSSEVTLRELFPCAKVGLPPPLPSKAALTAEHRSRMLSFTPGEHTMRYSVPPAPLQKRSATRGDSDFSSKRSDSGLRSEAVRESNSLTMQRAELTSRASESSVQARSSEMSRDFDFISCLAELRSDWSFETAVGSSAAEVENLRAREVKIRCSSIEWRIARS